MARRKQSLERNRQKKRERRKHRGQKSGGAATPVRLSRKLAERLDEAHDLINRGRFAEAEELLKKADRRGTTCPEVVEALMFLYQCSNNREQCCNAAKRLAILRPRDPEPSMMFAQESMYSGRVATALLHYQQFIEQWPEHAYVVKAKKAIELLIPETEGRIKESDFPKDSGLECLVLHEESLRLLQKGEYAACITKCQELLDVAPEFVSARNNMAIAYFQSGQPQLAVSTAEQTRELVPDNQFAKIALAKLYFLSGRANAAQQLADAVVADPPAEPDPMLAAFEVLAMLGRDEDLLQLASTNAKESDGFGEQGIAIQYHYLAYAKYRLGDIESAKATWTKCLKLFKDHPDARENVLDLNSGEGHAPWSCDCAKWIPKETMEHVIQTRRDKTKSISAQHLAVASLVPALLDRGDPLGREIALRLAMADSTPLMLDALKTFALGSRGPDSMRSDALSFLLQKGAVDAGPHRIYLRGAWTDIQLLAAQITTEPLQSASSPSVLKKLNRGIEASNRDDYELAESLFEQVIEIEPDNCSAIYNLCVVWLKRDGHAGDAKAQVRLERLHRDFPDYPFAVIALAQFAGDRGDCQQARDLLAPLFQAKKMHFMEAMALFTAQAQIFLAENDINAAEGAFSVLSQIAGENDPNVLQLRKRIDRASKKTGVRKLFSRS